LGVEDIALGAILSAAAGYITQRIIRWEERKERKKTDKIGAYKKLEGDLETWRIQSTRARSLDDETGLSDKALRLADKLDDFEGYHPELIDSDIIEPKLELDELLAAIRKPSGIPAPDEERWTPIEKSWEPVKTLKKRLKKKRELLEDP